MFWENIYILIKWQTFTSRILKKVDLTLKKSLLKNVTHTSFLTLKQSDPIFLCQNQSEIIRDEVSNWFDKKDDFKSEMALRCPTSIFIIYSLLSCPNWKYSL